MLLMGDEVGHTRKGNNNPYVQDNEINWFNWNELQTNQALWNFVSKLIAFRKAHPVLRHKRFLTAADIDWHGHEPNKPNWSASSRFVAFTLKGEKTLYIAFNAHFHQTTISLPAGLRWHLVVDTSQGWDQQNFEHPEKGTILSSTFKMSPYSAIVAKSS